MGGKSVTGVYARKTFILIDLRKHEYGQERLELAPTPNNIKYAERLREQILREIHGGSFVLKAHFPNSPRVQRSTGMYSFGDLVENWLAWKKSMFLAPTTLIEYRNALKCHFGDWYDLSARSLTLVIVRDHLTTLQFATVKTRNNVVNILRGVLEYGFAQELIAHNIAPFLTNVKRKQRPDPDPLSPPEIDCLLQTLDKLFGKEAVNYYESAIFGGFRPSEQIALKWPKVNLKKGVTRVDAARVRRFDKDTKTHEHRDVELVDRAWQALRRQHVMTEKHESKSVFINPVTNLPFTDTAWTLENWWKPALVEAGIRARDQRQTRHSFATMALMKGCKPAWAARQLGHSTEMFYNVYSTWIDGADKGAERDKFTDD